MAGKRLLRQIIIRYFEWIPWLRGKGRLFNLGNRYDLFSPPFVFNFRDGIKMYIDVNDWIQKNIFFHKVYEKRETGAWIAMAKGAEVILDVGANVGYYTILAASKTKGQVHSFEPISVTFETLKRNTGINKLENVTLNRKIISDRPGTSKIYLAESGNSGMSSMIRGSGITETFEEVEVMTLDMYINNLSLEKVDLVKIDVEGGELAVIKGMTGILEKFKPVIMIEVLNETLARFGGKFEDVYSFFDQFGYEAFDFPGKKGKLKIEAPKEKIGLVMFTHKENSRLSDLV